MAPNLTRYRIDLDAAADQMGLIDWMALQNRHPSSVEMPPYTWLKAEARAIVEAALVPDTTLQQIADAWNDDPTFQAMVRDDNADLAALLDGLVNNE